MWMDVVLLAVALMPLAPLSRFRWPEPGVFNQAIQEPVSSAPAQC